MSPEGTKSGLIEPLIMIYSRSNVTSTLDTVNSMHIVHDFDHIMAEPWTNSNREFAILMMEGYEILLSYFINEKDANFEEEYKGK